MNSIDLYQMVSSVFGEEAPRLGTVDIFCVGGAAKSDRLSVYLGCVREQRKGSLLGATKPVCLVVGTKTIESYVPYQASSADKQADNPLPCKEEIQCDLLPNMQADSLVAFVECLPEKSIVVGIDVGLLRFLGGAVFEPIGNEFSIRLPEDIWVPQLVALIEQLEVIARQRNLYVLLDVGYLKPHRAELTKLLGESQARVLCAYLADDSEHTIEDITGNWPAWIQQGLIAKLITSTELVPGLDAEDRALLRAQIFHRSGLRAQVLEEIEKLQDVDATKVDTLVELARLACDNGAIVLARNLLRRCISGLHTLEALEAALHIAWRIGDSAAEAQIATRLEDSFPNSDLNIRRQVRRAHLARDYASAATAALQLPGGKAESEAYAFLFQQLGGDGIPNYPEINRRISSSRAEWASLAQEALVQDALSRGLIIHALDIVDLLPATDRSTRNGALLALDAIGQIAMARVPTSDELAVPAERLDAPLKLIITYLSAHPEDAYVLSRVRQLLSVDGSGRHGEAAIIFLLLDQMQAPITSTGEHPGKELPAEELHRRLPEFAKAFEWLTDNGPVVLGKTRLPQELFKGDPHVLLASITRLIAYFEGRVVDKLDVGAILNWLGLGMSIAPYAEGTLQDLRMLYAAAALLAKSGQQQQARDLCQQVLVAAGEIPQRQRLAWSIVSSVYLAIGNRLEALVTATCARAIDCPIDPQDAWQEANDLARMFRELHMYDPALAAHNLASAVLDELNAGESMRVQHQYLGLTIRVKQLTRGTSIQHDELLALLSDTCSLSKLVLSRNVSRQPIALLLGQLITIAEDLGIPVESHMRDLFADLQREGGTSDPVVAAASVKSCTANDLLAAHLKSERARFSADTAYDVRHVVMLAERFLGARRQSLNPVESIFAIELLTDRAIAAPGWQVWQEPVLPLEEIDTASDIAKQASAGGMSVVVTGLDVTGAMVRVDCCNGALGIVHFESTSNFTGHALLEWCKEYPYAYAAEDAHANVFYLSTEGLKVSPLPPSPLLVVASTRLQSLPLNLWRVGDDFAGRTHAMASVPSLSWLRAARARPSCSDHRRLAWISTSEAQGRTLALVADWLSDTFAGYGVSLNTDAALPVDFIGAKLAIVTAHGGIAPGGKSFFTRVSDEGSLSVSSRRLSDALRNVEVVVLFVCSGGRADKNPSGETVSGMAKQLLDAGCSAVIASPWPLDPRVTYHWLPTFMASWREGDNLAEANFKANQKVDAAYPGLFAYSLAMHVFGNPLIEYGQ